MDLASMKKALWSIEFMHASARSGQKADAQSIRGARARGSMGKV
jgi:hypothetical protein